MMSTLLSARDTVIGQPLMSFWDPASGARFEAHSPSDRPDLWERYVSGITACYRKFGVLNALDLGSLDSGDSTSLFFVAIGPDEEVVAGVRFHGPLQDGTDAYALKEFASDPRGVATIRRLIDDRVIFGVTEIKGGWVSQGFPRRRDLGNALARSFLHGMDALRVQFAFCTAATHAIGRWTTTGGREVPGLDPVAYPDERYRTAMMWWDRTTVHEYGDPAQLRRFRSETAARGPVAEPVGVLSEPVTAGAL